MTTLKPRTVQEFAKFLDMSEKTIRRWIKQGKLVAELKNGKYFIETEKNLAFISSQKRRSNKQPEVWVPEGIQRYNEWHEILDEFCWLLKISYTHRNDVKDRAFRLDQLFANYLMANKVKLSKVKGIFTTNPKPDFDLITDDLKRGWYNEFAYAIPIKSSTLGLSFSDIAINKSTSDDRFAFPSWRIITAYYAVYFYLRSVTIQKQGTCTSPQKLDSKLTFLIEDLNTCSVVARATPAHILPA